MNTERHKGRVIRINGQSPANALKEAELELTLAKAKVSASRISFSETARPEADLMLHRAEQKLARVKELLGEGKTPVKAGGGGVYIDVQSIDNAFRKFTETSAAVAKARAAQSRDERALIEAVRDAGAELDRLRAERGAAHEASMEARKAFDAAGDKLTEARTALLKHLGGGAVFP